jgi:type VI secretion system secreted protein VgrG
VGPVGQDDVYTDEYGRVRVQFHWDRIGDNDDRSSTWLRVASAWSGAELGATAVPRVGSEVIVQWLGGNPDRPIIMGSVFNARNMPPWTLPTQHSLTGLRSRELAPGSGNAPGGRGNHLVLDDTNEKIQAQLKSDHQCSQLSLGHITRIDDTSGRKDERGEGWELATDAWGILRAGKGLLITTDARANAESHTKDLREALARLTNARQEQEAQAKLAEKAGAQDPVGHQADVARCLVSCDHVPRRSWPLFRAKAMLSELIAGFSSPGIQTHQEQLAA